MAELRIWLTLNATGNEFRTPQTIETILRGKVKPVILGSTGASFPLPILLFCRHPTVIINSYCHVMASSIGGELTNKGVVSREPIPKGRFRWDECLRVHFFKVVTVCHTGFLKEIEGVGRQKVVVLAATPEMWTRLYNSLDPPPLLTHPILSCLFGTFVRLLYVFHKVHP